MMNKVILADSQAIFRAGMAKVLVAEGEIQIVAQCSDPDRLQHAVTTFPGVVVIFAASLLQDMAAFQAQLHSIGSRGVVIAENHDDLIQHQQYGFYGVVFRNVTGPALVECIRHVARGDRWNPPYLAKIETPDEDMVGTRVRDRLTPKEMRIVALIGQGCRNREIATRLKTTEQVIKNYLRSIYDKSGVSDRLELALFTIHHRALAQAAAEISRKMEAEEIGELSTASNKEILVASY